MKHLSIYSLLLSAALFLSACDNDDDDTSLNNTDRNFANMAAIANRAEVELGQVALSRATADSVRMFAQLMVSDHALGIAKLDSLANRYGISLPTTLDSTHQAMKARLMTLTGRTFDTAYMNGQIIDHQNAIGLHIDESNNGNNVDFRNYANEQLPHLRMHLTLADSVRFKLR